MLKHLPTTYKPKGKAREQLAYISAIEAELLKALTDGRSDMTRHGVPSFADDSARNYNSGYGGASPTRSNNTPSNNGPQNQNNPSSPPTRSNNTPSRANNTPSNNGPQNQNNPSSPPSRSPNNSPSNGNRQAPDVNNRAGGRATNVGGGYYKGTTPTTRDVNNRGNGLGGTPQTQNLMQRTQEKAYQNRLATQHNQYRSPNDYPGEDLTRTGYITDQYKQYRSPPNVVNRPDPRQNRPQKLADQYNQYRSPPGVPITGTGDYLANRVAPPDIYGPSGLRGLLGPNGEPRLQPTPRTTAYQTAQQLRAMHPKLAKRTDQTDLTDALNILGQALPSEGFVAKYGIDAMNDLGRVGMNQIIGGYSPQKMIEGMDSTGLRKATKHLKNMVPANSPKAYQAQVAIREALNMQGVSPQARDASNFVAAGTPMVQGVNPVGKPLNGTQFGNDPTWNNRIAARNEVGQQRLAGQVPTARPPVQTAGVTPMGGPPQPQVSRPPPQAPAPTPQVSRPPVADTGPSMWESLKETAQAGYQQYTDANKKINDYGGGEKVQKLGKFMQALGGDGNPAPDMNAVRNAKGGGGTGGMIPAAGPDNPGSGGGNGGAPKVVQQTPQFTWVQWAPGQPPTQIPTQALQSGKPPKVVAKGPEFSWVQWMPGQPPAQVPNTVIASIKPGKHGLSKLPKHGVA